tara:strand:+ start:1098 stop:1454 length:357 start_codon:yes stop_codon:yes gene_type:complete
MAELLEMLEEGSIIGVVVVSFIILLRLAQRYGLNVKCGMFSIDLRRPQTKQKQMKYESIQEMQRLKNEELSLRVRDKELQLEILKEQKSQNGVGVEESNEGEISMNGIKLDSEISEVI